MFDTQNLLDCLYESVKKEGEKFSPETIRDSEIQLFSTKTTFRLVIGEYALEAGEHNFSRSWGEIMREEQENKI